jgi:hypothetical protein
MNRKVGLLPCSTDIIKAFVVCNTEKELTALVYKHNEYVMSIDVPTEQRKPDICISRNYKSTEAILKEFGF